MGMKRSILIYVWNSYRYAYRPAASYWPLLTGTSASTYYTYATYYLLELSRLYVDGNRKINSTGTACRQGAKKRRKRNVPESQQPTRTPFPNSLGALNDVNNGG